MAEELGPAVLTLSTDPKAFIAGLDKARDRQLAFKRETDAVAKASSDAFKNAFQAPQISQTSESFRGLFANIKATGQASSDASGQFRGMFTSIKQGAEAANPPTKSLWEQFGNVKSAVSGLLALKVSQWAIQGIQSTLDYADQLENLSTATDISVGGLQRLEAIGVTSHVSMDDLAHSVEQLHKHLDDPAAQKAIRDMGLDYARIRALKPEDQFLEIAQAVAAIEDPVEKANAGAALFGRTWNTIAPAIKGNLKEIADGVETMSDAQVEALDRAGDAWDTWYLKATRKLKAFLGDLVSTSEQLPLGMLGLMAAMATGNFSAIQAASQKAKAIAEEDAFRKSMPKVAGPGGLIAGGLAAIDADPERIIRETNEALKTHRTVVDRAGDAWTQLVAKTEGSQGAFKDSINLMHGLAAVTAFQEEAARKDREAWIDLVNTVEGARAPFQQQIDLMHGLTGFATFQDLPRVYGQSRSSGMAAFGPAKLPNRAPTGASSFASDLFSAVPGAIQAAIQGGGSKLQAAGSAMGSVLFGPNSSATNLISGGITKLFGKDGFLGKTLSSAVPIIGSMIGPAIEGLGKLWGKVFGTAGRDAVRDFASKSGGFEALHARLGTLGAEGEQLWKTLTQGVGRNNPEQAKAAIEKVEAAFAAFEQGVRDAEGAVANIGSRLEHVTDISPEVKAGLQDALNAKTPQEFLAALQNVNSQLDTTAQKHQHLKDLADKYGISLKDMGHEFAQGEIDAMAQVLLQDFADLTAEGVDSTAILKGMKDKYNELVQAAKESGAEIPLSMKPTLQKLLDMGELVDKDGKKLTDLDGLHFGDSLETRLGDIKDVVNDLRLAIDNLANAFRGLPTSLPQVPSVNTSPRSQSDTSGIENGPDYNGFDPYSYQNAESSARGSFVRPWGLQYLSAGGLATAATIAALSMAPIYAARGFEPRGTDTVPAMTTTGKRLMLTPGEGIVSTLGMSNLGIDGLRAYNRGELPMRGGTDTSRMESQLSAVHQELQEQTLELASIRDAVMAAKQTSVQINGREVVQATIETLDSGGGILTHMRQTLGVG